MPRSRRLVLWLSTVTTVATMALFGTATSASADIPNVLISNAVDGLCASEANPAASPVIQSTCLGYPREIWTFTTVTSGVYAIHNSYSGLCLTSGPILGDTLSDGQCTGGAAQWNIVGTGSKVSLRNPLYNLCMVRADAVVNSQLLVSACPYNVNGGQWNSPDYA